MFRQGLVALLERDGFEIVGAASNGREAVHLARKLTPQAIVLDLNMAGLNGIDAAREIQRRSPTTRTVLLTMFEDERYVLEAFRAGLRGYVLKAQASTDLAEALREVVAGRRYVSPGVAGAVVEAYLRDVKSTSDLLTPKERQVLQLVAEGNSTKTIAQILNLAVKTAESHRARLMQKVNVRNTAGLVRYAVREGLIRP
jgi:DNA-binding NarL/FixJ family response regulator